MTIGSLVHELFQIVLRRKINSIKNIKSASEELLYSKQTAIMLYSSQMTLEEARLELNKFTIKIYSFVQRYVTGDYSVKTSPDTFSGCIDSIQDIEENIWVPQLGLKGKVDVSVNVKERNKNNKDHMPLELKTGKASFSSEHKGQVIIYQMMMSEVGKKVDSGLLLYLREGIMKEVSITRHAQRDLIMLRNDLAYYSLKQLPETVNNKITIPELPEPINHHSACQACPYNVICCTYLKNDLKANLSENHPLQEVSKNCLSHLKDKYFEYFIHWTGIIAYEVEVSRKENQLKTIWTETAEKRQKHGRAIIDLEITGKVVGEDCSFIHVFNSIKGKQIDLTLSGFCLGDYLVVSTKNRIAIAAGKVETITRDNITLIFERNLSEMYPQSLFILDKYDSESTGVFNMTNLGALLDNRESSDRLRKIIIDKIKPTFQIHAPKMLLTKGSEVLSALNSIQRKAVIRAITANDYLLLKGLPGTGKTQTLVALIRLLVLIGKSVLITSHTHSAVDNILHRLLEHRVAFLRLGSSARISPKLLKHSENHYLNNCKTPSDVHDLYTKFQVVAVTCLGSSHPLLSQREFDICLVDEATQVFQASVIRPLLSAKTFVLVGDPDQLPPIVHSTEAKNLGANESLFARLDSTDATFVLTHQYRMNKTITKLANAVTYKGTLICANNTVANSKLEIFDLKKLTNTYGTEKWLTKCLSSHIDLSVVLLNTGNVFERNHLFVKVEEDNISNGNENTFGESTQRKIKEKKTKTRLYTNYCEAGLALYLIKALFESGVKGESVGIIAPFRAQVDLLRRILNKFEEGNENNMNVEVNTVDQYQGRDKEVIIYCCTKSNEDSLENSPAHDNEILEDQRRLTVAITRSKCKLILIGDVISLEKYSPFNNLFKNLGSICKIVLENGKMGFNWSTILDYLEIVAEAD